MPVVTVGRVAAATVKLVADVVLVSVIVSVAEDEPHVKVNVAEVSDATDMPLILAPVPPLTVNSPVGVS